MNSEFQKKRGGGLWQPNVNDVNLNQSTKKVWEKILKKRNVLVTDLIRPLQTKEALLQELLAMGERQTTQDRVTKTRAHFFFGTVGQGPTKPLGGRGTKSNVKQGNRQNSNGRGGRENDDPRKRGEGRCGGWTGLRQNPLGVQKTPTDPPSIRLYSKKRVPTGTRLNCQSKKNKTGNNPKQKRTEGQSLGNGNQGPEKA